MPYFSQAQSHNIATYIPYIYLHHRSDQHHIIAAAADNNISDVRTIFDSLDWSEENYRMLEEIGQSTEQVHVCVSATNEVRIAILCILLATVYIANIAKYKMFKGQNFYSFHGFCLNRKCFPMNFKVFWYLWMLFCCKSESFSVNTHLVT